MRRMFSRSLVVRRRCARAVALRDSPHRAAVRPHEQFARVDATKPSSRSREMENPMFARSVFAITAAVLVGLAAYAPPETAARNDRPALRGDTGVSVAVLKIEAEPRIRK